MVSSDGRGCGLSVATSADFHMATHNEVVRHLKDLGCHETDIGDAMFEADPLWLNRLSKPVTERP